VVASFFWWAAPLCLSSQGGNHGWCISPERSTTSGTGAKTERRYQLPHFARLYHAEGGVDMLWLWPEVDRGEATQLLGFGQSLNGLPCRRCVVVLSACWAENVIAYKHLWIESKSSAMPLLDARA